jgi:hypothetical protein
MPLIYAQWGPFSGGPSSNVVKLCKKCGKLFRTTMPNAKWCEKCRGLRPYRKKPTIYTHVCENATCAKTFQTHQSKARFCSDNCRKEFHYVKEVTPRICKNPDCRVEFFASSARQYCTPSCAYKVKLKREEERRNAQST